MATDYEKHLRFENAKEELNRLRAENKRLAKCCTRRGERMEIMRGTGVYSEDWFNEDGSAK